LRVRVSFTLGLIIFPYPMLRTERQLSGRLRVAKTQTYPERSAGRADSGTDLDSAAPDALKRSPTGPL